MMARYVIVGIQYTNCIKENKEKLYELDHNAEYAMNSTIPTKKKKYIRANLAKKDRNNQHIIHLTQGNHSLLDRYQNIGRFRYQSSTGSCRYVQE